MDYRCDKVDAIKAIAQQGFCVSGGDEYIFSFTNSIML